MNQIYSRPLNNDECVDYFITNALGYTGSSNIIPLIVEGEIGLLNFDFKQNTFNSEQFRQKGVRDDSARWKLRKKIVNELFTLRRIDSDEKIKLGNGGALPKSELKKDSLATILIGLPASGKSGIANIIADNYGAVILDSDYAKRKLPEFKNYKFGASLVHLESDALIFKFTDQSKPDDFQTLFEKCRESKTNLVIPKIGYDHSSVTKLAKKLKDEFGYKVNLTLVNLDRKKATLRAIERYKRTKRYVPLGLIFDQYGNDPILTYYILKSKQKGLFNSFGEISTDVPFKSSPICTECENDNPSKLFKFE